MSAEPSLQRPDVGVDAPAVKGASGRNDSTTKNNAHQPSDGSGQAGRSRHARRGRRRRGRRSGRGGGQQQAQQTAPEAGSGRSADAQPSPTAGEGQGTAKPSNSRSGGPRGAAGKNGAKGGPKNSTTRNGSNRGQAGKNGGKSGAGKNILPGTDGRAAEIESPTPEGTGPAPSGANTPASMPRTRRRTARRAEGETAPRLHTVRETSAGGLVLSDIDAPFDELSAALIGRIDRRGRMMWSLPKGHIETGETAEQTAMREVAEETGISGTIVAPLGKIDYWFVSEGKRIHKTVHHYLLRFTGGELSDADYEVSAVAWVPLTELPRRLTYSDERRLARMAESVIADLQSDPHRLAQSEANCLRTEPNDYEKAAAARNQRRNEPPPAPKPRRRRRRPRRAASGES